MKERRNGSNGVSTLQIALSTGLISISAILLVIAAPANFEKAPQHNRYGFQPEESGDSTTALGNYPDTSVSLSGNATVTPDGAPTNTTSINVFTSTNFQGTLAGDPTTGIVRVTDAHPAGTYTVTVRTFNGGSQNATRTFTLTVTTPVTCTPVTFAAATNFGAGPLPLSLAVGDFNGDGKQDLAVANHGIEAPHPQPGSVWILLGDGAGNFSATNFASGAVGHPDSVAVGDFNGDGKQDLALAGESVPGVWILLGDGAGNFSAPTGYVASAFAIAVGDFNGDGKQDLAATGVAAWILLGDGAGGFSAPTNFGTGSFPISIATGDFNGDGKQDLAVANRDSNNVSILLGDGTGNFSAPVNFDVGTHPFALAVGDFNGDGKQDLAVANSDSNNVSILLGDGAGNFTATNFASGAIGHPDSVAVGDFNGDGKQDLAVANLDSNNVSILLGDGAGNFTAPTSYVAGNFAIAVGDFNGDGKQDLATSGPVSILLRTCTSTPTPTATATLTPSPTPTATATASPTATPSCSGPGGGSMDGNVSYCSNPVPAPVPGVAIIWVNFTITTTDSSGNYGFFNKGEGGWITCSKADLSPGSPGINTIDVVAVQRHFLVIGTPLSGCRLTAADVNGDASINTIDVVAIQRFYLGFSTGTAYVGKYRFDPSIRCFNPQPNQNFDTLVFGDVAAPFIY